MSVNYTYTILKVDTTARCMEVVYEATGHETQHVGTRLPYEGETVEQIVRMYAPLAYWAEKKRAVLSPQVGYTGAVNAADEEAQAFAELEARNAQQQPISEGAQNL